MPILHNSIIAAAADSTPAEDPVTRSLRFDDGRSPYFVRAASDIGTPTDAKKVTVAFWFKLGSMSGARRGLVSSSNSAGSDYWMAEIDASDRLSWGINDGSGSVQGHFTTNRVFRDPSAWYHVCFSVDSTAAEADRAIIYINGVRETSFDTINYWPVDWLNEFNEGTYSQSIGSWKGTSLFFDGLIADVYNIDGQQLEPSEFIESNGYGGYKPKEYTGTYGTNGFHLEFEDYGDHSLIGLDSSLGNAINWDTSKYRSGYTAPSWSENDTEFSGASGVVQHTMSNFAGSGKYYAEFTITETGSGGTISGVGPVSEDWWTGSSIDNYMWVDDGASMLNTETIRVPNGGSANVDCSSDIDLDNDRIGIEVDVAANEAFFYRVNGDGKALIASLTEATHGIDFGERVAWGCTVHDGKHDIRGYFTSASWLQAPSEGFAAMPSGNHFEATNLNSTDIRTDVPTDSFCVMSPIDKGSGVTLSEGNLKATFNNNWDNVRGTMGATSGKFYFEVIGTINASNRWNSGIDINQKCEVDTYNSNTGSIVYALYDGVIYNGTGSAGGSGNFNSSYYVSATQDQSETNARIGVAVDIDAGKVWFRFNNGSWENSGGDPTSESSSGTITFTANSLVQPLFAGYGATFTAYFQESEWTDTAPTDYGEWKTSRLGTPVVTPTSHFNTVLYSGSYDSSSGYGTASQGITGVGFSPDICWIKDRDNQAGNSNSYYGHYWFDTVLGTGSAINIDAEQGLSGSLNSSEDGVSSFDSDGFTVDEAEETNFAYDSSYSYGDPDTFERYVAWCWKLGTTASSWSGSGQDPDSEQYNSDAGISIIDYTDGGSGSSVTLNHSLGTAPEFAMALDYAGMAGSHYAWHKDLTAGYYLELSGNGSQASDSTYFPSSPATNTTFEVGSSLADGMQSHVALFRPVEGFSKFGKYEGNGSTDGAFIYTGFRPAFVLIKNIGASQDWFLLDNKRDGYNVVDDFLEPNTSNAEATASTNKADFTANGFKLRGSGSVTNQNNTSFVYAAFAESPFKHANAR